MAKKVGKRTMQNVWDRFVKESKLPNRYSTGCWGWKNSKGEILGDCVNQIKKEGWGVDDKITYDNRYDYIATNKDTMPDVDICHFYNNSSNKSTDMTKIPKDRLSFVYTKPIGEHIGIYNPKTNTVYEMCAGSIMGIRETKLNTNYWDGGWSTGSKYFTDSIISTPSNPVNPTPSIKAGQKVSLNNTPCYASESAKTPYGTKSGTFYLWDDVVKNGRIRITNAASRVGVAGQVTCWVNVADIGLTTTTTTASKPKPVNEDYRKSREPNRFKVMLKGKQIEADTLYDNAVATAKKYGAVIIDGKTKKQIYPK